MLVGKQSRPVQTNQQGVEHLGRACPSGLLSVFVSVILSRLVFLMKLLCSKAVKGLLVSGVCGIGACI